MATASTQNHQKKTKSPCKSERIVIVGAGVFGLATARELSGRGYSDITVLDRCPPPVPDGSSVDISRTIRPDYADNFYAKLGLEALEGWNNEYRPFFHNSGLLSLTQDLKHSYLEGSIDNLRSLGKSIHRFQGNEIKTRYPGIHGDLSHTKGYVNTASGWADAEGSIRYLARQCALAGVSFISGARGTVISLLVEGQRVAGVQTRSQIPVYADRLIVATGAWTPHLMDMSRVSVSDVQPVGFMQLTSKEAQEMEGCPVMIDFSTGWFVFPPTPGTHILKMARHGYGYEIVRQIQARQISVSAPEMSKDNSASTFIPEDADKALRDGLALFLPKFKDRKFIRRRLCWYTDTPKGNFIVDHHPDYSNAFLATGGSGQ